MSQIKAIDYWTNIFTPEGLRRMYTENPELSRLVSWWNMDERLRGYTPEEFVRHMDELGIEKTYVPSFKMQSYKTRSLLLSVDVADVRNIMEKTGGRVGGLYGFDVGRGMDAVRELEVAVKEWGFAGGHLHANGWAIPLNHRELYPFYAKCEELDVPVVLQCGHSAEHMPSEGSRPIYLDDVALYFPNLRIVASHTGWPWVQELVALAWKHPNLYIGAGAHAPRYWDPALVQFLNTRGQGKVLWGSDFPVVTHKDSLTQVAEIQLKDSARVKLLRGAAEKVFRICGGKGT
jgi:predicted TIM-barrel fold metal-dependent hydrolase